MNQNPSVICSKLGIKQTAKTTTPHKLSRCGFNAAHTSRNWSSTVNNSAEHKCTDQRSAGAQRAVLERWHSHNRSAHHAVTAIDAARATEREKESRGEFKSLRAIKTAQIRQTTNLTKHKCKDWTQRCQSSFNE